MLCFRTLPALHYTHDQAAASETFNISLGARLMPSGSAVPQAEAGLVAKGHPRHEDESAMARRLLQAHLSKEHHSHLMVTVLEVRGLHPRKGVCAADSDFQVALGHAICSLVLSTLCLVTAQSFVRQQLLKQHLCLCHPWLLHSRKPTQI